MPERIRLSRAKGWRLPAGAVNCARPGAWGNPYVVGRDGTRAYCVELYAHLLAGNLNMTSEATRDEQRRCRDYVEAHIDELRGKDLACWCRLDGKPCHADVLLRLANSSVSATDSEVGKPQ